MVYNMAFSHEKRHYLHAKLDEVLHLWYRNAGQGYFNLVVNNGKPEFQFGVHLDMNDRLQSDHRYPSPKGHVLRLIKKEIEVELLHIKQQR